MKIDILATHYFVLLDACLGAQWAHDMSMRLFFLPCEAGTRKLLDS